MTQAQRVIRKFGGEKALAQAIGCNLATIYKWSYPQPRGRGGLIPGPALRKIMDVARLHGVLLTSEDLAP